MSLGGATVLVFVSLTWFLQSIRFFRSKYFFLLEIKLNQFEQTWFKLIMVHVNFCPLQSLLRYELSRSSLL